MSNEHPTFGKELGHRIEKVVAKFRTKGAAAKCVGIVPEQLNKWIGGATKVPINGLYLLAQGVDEDFCWLCTGQKQGYANLASTIEKDAVPIEYAYKAARKIEEWLREEGRRIEDDDFRLELLELWANELYTDDLRAREAGLDHAVDTGRPGWLKLVASK